MTQQRQAAKQSTQAKRSLLTTAELIEVTKANRGSDNCLGYGPISPRIKTLPVIQFQCLFW